MTKPEPKLVYFCPYCRRIFQHEIAICPNCNGTVIAQNASLCPSCGQTLPEGASTCPSCNRSVIDSLSDEAMHYAPAERPSLLWYVFPFVLGLIGALIGYIVLKDENETMAIRLIQVGAVMTVLDIAIVLFLAF